MRRALPRRAGRIVRLCSVSAPRFSGGRSAALRRRFAGLQGAGAALPGTAVARSPVSTLRGLPGTPKASLGLIVGSARGHDG